MKEVSLTQGKVALVDDEDFDLISRYKWLANKQKTTFYAAARISNQVGHKEWIYMHILIMGTKPGYEIDHRDRDGLNNRRSNLRFATRSQNIRNASPRGMTSSKYKGVHWDKGTSKWRAKIYNGTKVIHLGLFNEEEEAARTYDQAAMKYFGEFAYINLQERSG